MDADRLKVLEDTVAAFGFLQLNQSLEAIAEIKRLREILFYQGIDIDRCPVLIKGGQCGLATGYEGGHKWLNGN